MGKRKAHGLQARSKGGEIFTIGRSGRFYPRAYEKKKYGFVLSPPGEN